MSDVARALEGVRARIAAAAARAERDPSGVRIVGVTKSVAADRIATAIACGLTDVGENRAQELRAKQRALETAEVRWHFVGAVQTNKVRDVVGRVDVIHAVDSERLAAAVARRAQAAGLVQRVLVEVNTSAELTKRGCAPQAAASLVEAAASMPGVEVAGLMTIAAQGGGDAARRSFADLRRIRDEIGSAFAATGELSMGMSGDYEVAVEEGATIVRIGTAIFGERPR